MDSAMIDSAAHSASAAAASSSPPAAAAAAAAHASPPAPVPRDAVSIESLLLSMGLAPGSYQPRVVAQLLEVAHRYTREVLEDAQDYCAHRDRDGKAHLEPDDVELAVQSRLSDTFVPPPPKEFLYRLAADRNALPLPIVPTREGVHLPADRFCLMQPNYRIKTSSAATQNKKQQAESKHNA